MRKMYVCFFAIAFLSGGCTGKERIEIGFEHQGMLPGYTVCAVRSETSVFPADQVVLEVSYSLYREEGEPEGYSFACFALYFSDSEFWNSPQYLQPINDYRLIDGLYFVKEIKENDYVPEDYTMTMDIFSGKKFKHSELLTVPQGVFTDESGSFDFRLIEFCHVLDNGGYCLTYSYSVIVDYERIDEKTVRLSD